MAENLAAERGHATVDQEYTPAQRAGRAEISALSIKIRHCSQKRDSARSKMLDELFPFPVDAPYVAEAARCNRLISQYRAQIAEINARCGFRYFLL